MQQHNFHDDSEMASHATYDPGQQILYVTFISGPTTIAYRNVSETLFEELKSTAYPDVCMRFKIQAAHPFRRVEPAFETMDYSFMK